MNTNEWKNEYELQESRCRTVEREITQARAQVELLEQCGEGGTHSHKVWLDYTREVINRWQYVRAWRDHVHCQYYCASRHVEKTASYLRPLLAAALLVVLLPVLGAIRLTGDSGAVMVLAAGFGGLTTLLWELANLMALIDYGSAPAHTFVGVGLPLLILLAVPSLFLLLAGLTGVLSVTNGWMLLVGLVLINTIQRRTAHILRYLI